MSAWWSRSVHVVHVVPDQEHSSTTVSVQDGTGMEICNANCACMTDRLDRTFKGYGTSGGHAQPPLLGYFFSRSTIHRAIRLLPIE